MARPVRVGALIDLEWSEGAGGHVKSWEHFAAAAADVPEALDLTVYFLAPQASLKTLAPNARVVLLAPALGTRRLRFLRGNVQHTDLAPYRPRLVPVLARHDLLHVTAPFALGNTALRVARTRGVPLVASIHSDFPALSRVYAQAIGARLFGARAVERLRFAERVAERAQRRMDRLLAACDRILVSHPGERARLLALRGPGVLGQLRRGVDRDHFHPSRRDRERLAREYGIPPDVPVVLFVGRVDASKGVGVLAEAARRLIDAGQPLHVLIAGRGAASDAVRATLGGHVTLAGVQPQEALAWLYASADLLVLPSRTEVLPNVVIEARASGTPPLVTAGDGGATLVERSGVDGVVVPDTDPATWAAALAPLLADPALRARMGRAAREATEARWPSWSQVLTEDLLPVWQDVVARRRRQTG
jgi:glycosyltransferase involved in cell wall biosynthesis